MNNYPVRNHSLLTLHHAKPVNKVFNCSFFSLFIYSMLTLPQGKRGIAISRGRRCSLTINKGGQGTLFLSPVRYAAYATYGGVSFEAQEEFGD